MAHFAKIGVNNVVLGVDRVDNKDCMTPEGEFQEEIGVRLLDSITGHASWVQCSINTVEGTHLHNRDPLRLNFPSPGWIYDQSLDGFIEPSDSVPVSYILNPDTGRYIPPVPYPGGSNGDGKRYKWDDENTQWVEMDLSEYYV